MGHPTREAVAKLVAGARAFAERSPRLAWCLELSAVWALLWICAFRLQFATPGLTETDSFFHIKVAWLMRTQGLLRSFPWAALSTWRDHYFDKDFGFHVLLFPFTFGDLARGAKYAAVTYGSGLFLSFYAVMRLRRLRFTWAWLLLLASAVFFMARVCQMRPHLISVSLSLWGVYFILRGSWRAVALIGVVYALSYTAPHVLILYALIHAGCVFVTGGGGAPQEPGVWGRSRPHRGRAWKLPAAATGGVLLGTLLHPQFPQNFWAWRIQLVGVFTHMLGHGPDLALGVELLPITTRLALSTCLGIYLAVIAATLALPRLRDRTGDGLPTLFAIANGYFIMDCVANRFIEYMAPFSLWLCAEIITRHAAAEEGRPPLPVGERWWRLVRIAVPAGIVALAARSLVGNARELRRDGGDGDAGPMAKAAAWIAANTPEGALVFTCSWSFSSRLFFYDHRNRYMVFLDPSYMYYLSSETWQTWSDVSAGRARDPVSSLRDTLGARYGVCRSRPDAALEAQLRADPRVHLHEIDKALYVFAIEGEEGGT